MEHDTLRFLDKWIGLPICWFFTGLRYVTRLFLGKQKLKTPQRVLVIKLSEMGSSVLAYPAFLEIQRRVKDGRLFVLVFAQNRPILDAMKVAPPENIFSVRTSSFPALVGDGWRALRRLRQADIDSTVDMDFFSRFTAALAFMICRGTRVGFHRFTNEGLNRGDLLTHRVAYSAHVHTSVAFMCVAKSLFEDSRTVPLYKGKITIRPEDLPFYAPSSHDVDAIRAKIGLAGLKHDAGRNKLILINPNSSGLFRLRKWPLPHYAEFCALLLKTVPEARVVITGSAWETADANVILETVKCDRCVSMAGQTAFPELLALYSIANLMVTNDSGPAHFASVLKLPTLVLFGPETPLLYEPLGGLCKSIYSHFACSPCVSVYNNKKSPCLDNKCLQVIAPQDLLEEALQMLGKESPSAALR